MFEGTDLSVAYGGSMYEESSPEPSIPPASGNRPEMAVSSQKDYPPPMKYRPESAMEFEEAPPQPNQKYAQRNPSTYAYSEPPARAPTPDHAMAPVPSFAPSPAVYYPTFWDRLASRKTEVYKLFAFSLVIVLAVAIHSVAQHYLNQYVGKAFLSELQEFLVRLSYPVIIILVIWIMKAM